MSIGARVKSSGLSVVEVSIALLIIGIVTAASIQTYRTINSAKPLKQTFANEKSIQVALERFLATKGRLPCPAQLTLPPDVLNAGAEQCVGAAGLFVVPSSSPPAAAGSVLVGAVPYAALGIENKKSYDGWGRKLLYAVTGSMTDAATYANTGGKIVVKDLNVPATPLSTDAHVVVLSQGPGGFGAYEASPGSGSLHQPCGTVLTGKDFENCNNDAVFVDYNRAIPLPVTHSARSLAQGPYRFESVVHPVFHIRVEGDKWALDVTPTVKAGTQLSGRVGIGTREPAERLEVNDSVLSDTRVRSEQFGNIGASGTVNAFPTSMIAGTTGTACPGSALTGIHNASRDCTPPITALTTPGLTGDCYGTYGTYAVGVKPGGEFLCRINGRCMNELDPTMIVSSYLKPGPTLGNTGANYFPCQFGTISSMTAALPDKWTWTCQGANGGTHENCQAIRKTDGVCGDPITNVEYACIFNAALAPAPNVGAGMSVAKPNSGIPYDNEKWEWTCQEYNGGVSATTCSKFIPFDGVCGTADSSSPLPTYTADYSPPTTGLCARGDASTVVYFSPDKWKWTCDGRHLSTNASGKTANTATCYAPRKTYGTCASTHYNCSTSAPNESWSSNNSTDGAESTQNERWIWSCNGYNGGSVDNSCNEYKPIPAVCNAPGATSATSGTCYRGALLVPTYSPAVTVTESGETYSYYDSCSYYHTPITAYSPSGCSSSCSGSSSTCVVCTSSTTTCSTGSYYRYSYTYDRTDNWTCLGMYGGANVGCSVTSSPATVTYSPTTACPTSTCPP